MALRVGFIGLGTIAKSMMEIAAEQVPGQLEFVGAVVRDMSADGRSLPVYRTVDELLSQGVDVVVEVAGHQGLREHGISVLEADTDLVILAIGALADPEFERQFRDAAERSAAQVRIPPGAIGALDAVAAAALGDLKHVRYTVRWRPTPILLNSEWAPFPEPKEIFCGPARQAASDYPERLNITAAVSLAGVGFDDTEVRIIVDPTTDRDIHSIEAEGELSSFRFEIRPGPPGSVIPMVARSVLLQLLTGQSPISIG